MVTIEDIQKHCGEFFTFHLADNRRISARIVGYETLFDTMDTDDEGRETVHLGFSGWAEQLYLDEIVSMEPYEGTEPVYYEPDLVLAKVS